MNIGIIGFGKMGQGIARLLEKNMKLSLVLESLNIENRAAGCTYCKNVAEVNDGLLNNIDVFIEFTAPESAKRMILEIIKRRKNARIVSGSTGWDFDCIKKEIAAAGTIFMRSSNFSVGINVLTSVLENISRSLSKTGKFDAAMVEYHHKAKKDSPSGTARMLAECVGRGGFEIPVSCVRSGYYPGQHTVSFDSMFETIEISHNARSRDVFCQGAVHAAKWLAEKSTPGTYCFKDVIADVFGGEI
ncbi:MAG: hypothetical protein JXA66_01295 [Oligoflexia bacterium]|nr:hypothetical protein [Oligoflexia bacterium]